jgi:hypothetical protein
MAVNPAEDIVNVWLQENKGYFTRQNVNVPKKKPRKLGNKKIYGGKGKEIDILGINNTGERIWVEVTVSPNPRKAKSTEQVRTMEKLVEEKFCLEKEEEVKEIFMNNHYEKWFIYSTKVFSGENSKEKIERFEKRIKDKFNVTAKHFEEVFEEAIKQIHYYSVDPTRIYLYYIKSFLLKKK